MNQLNGQDSFFYYLESQYSPLHLTQVNVYRRSGPKRRLSFDEIRAHFSERLSSIGVFHRKIMPVPLALDNPYWVDADNVDLDSHLFHIRLPTPGGVEELLGILPVIIERPLDPARPVWEAFFIDGLDTFLDYPKGSFALVIKVHHAAMDGAAGNELNHVLHDMTPKGDISFETATPKKAPVPTSGQMACSAALNWMMKPAQLYWKMTQTAFSVLLSPKKTTRAGRDIHVPKSRFNDKVSLTRIVRARVFNMDEVKSIRATIPGVTINDVLLTICGGFLRRYMLASGDLPEEPLVAALPVNARTAATMNAVGNYISVMRSPFGTHIENPIERLRWVTRATTKAKEDAEQIKLKEISGMVNAMPTLPIALISQLFGFFRLGRAGPALCNCVITNVPPLRDRFYLKGALLDVIVGPGPILDGMGLIISAITCNNKMGVTFTSCREMIPDPTFASECLRDAYKDLREATGVEEILET